MGGGGGGGHKASMSHVPLLSLPSLPVTAISPSCNDGITCHCAWGAWPALLPWPAVMALPNLGVASPPEESGSLGNVRHRIRNDE
jgi:hypothetical protein